MTAVYIDGVDHAVILTSDEDGALTRDDYGVTLWYPWSSLTEYPNT
jgi:hypothetical protein